MLGVCASPLRRLKLPAYQLVLHARVDVSMRHMYVVPALSKQVQCGTLLPTGR